MADENKDPNAEVEGETEKPQNGVLPLTRIKRIIKMSANSVNVSAGSAKLIQLCAEEYLRAFAKTATMYAEQAGRKTIQLKDLNRVIKDDWAFALLEDTLTDWPNDSDTQKITTSRVIGAAEADSSSLFHLPRQTEDTLPETDTMLTNREIIDEPDMGMESEFNETGIYLDLDNSFIGEETPAPTMEYLEKPDGPSCKLAEPLTFDNEMDMDADAQRPYNNKFLNYEEVEDDVDSFDDDDVDKTLTPPPTDFDIEDF